MNFTSSALRQHFLESIIPYQHAKKPSQIKKNNHFYKPQQFIWNNPHRTSNKMYNFYHLQNDKFNQTLKPRIDHLESEDRLASERSRIQRLRNFRNHTREKFNANKCKRKQLQSKIRTFSYGKNYSTVQLQRQKMDQTIKTKQITQVFNKRTQQQYNRGLNSFDENINKVKQIVDQQIKNTHDGIKNKFDKQKHNNELVNSQIKRRVLTKSQVKKSYL